MSLFICFLFLAATNMPLLPNKNFKVKGKDNSRERERGYIYKKERNRKGLDKSKLVNQMVKASK